MTAPVVKGWCPGALRPMLSGDGWVVRVRPTEARLTAAQVDDLTYLAEVHGNGFLEVTNRANLQLRGVRDNQVDLLTKGLVEAGLVDAALSLEAEARLNILVDPWWDDPAQDAYPVDAMILWHRLRAALVTPDAPPLPGKFGFALDTGPRGPSLTEASADIRIERAAGGLIVRADGLPSGRAVQDEGDVIETAMAMARWFVASGGVGADGRGRMRDHILRGAALPAPLAGEAVPFAPVRPEDRTNLVTPAFGVIEARTLRVLSRHAPEGLRVTPWRGFHLPTLIDEAGLRRTRTLILDRDSPRLRVSACVGAPFCEQGRGNTRHFAQLLARSLPTGATLHVSGCAKGCAHPGPAAITLVAQGDWTFGLVRNGTAADPPERVVALDPLSPFLPDVSAHAPPL